MRRILLASAMLVILTWPAPGADSKPIKVLIITGDHRGHDWRKTTPFLKEILTKAGMHVDVTETPAKDLTPSNLAKYDAFLLNYRDTANGPPQTRWSEENKQAFLDAVEGGKGLLVYHFASSAFASGSDFDKRYEQAIAGGWRKQGNHGKRHVFTVSIRNHEHPITKGLPAELKHNNDELYQNSVLPKGSLVLATAYSDKSLDPKNSGKQEPMVWVAHYGKGRVCEDALGHDVPAMQDPGFQTLLIRGVEWVATGTVHYPVPPELNSAAGSK
jgi:type 1 glutamine amidotransferase